MLLHDWISIVPETSSGVLQIRDGELSVGTVKEVGPGYRSDMGMFIETSASIEIGKKVLFTQHLSFDIDGVKVYRVRSRDVIEVL